MSYIHVLVSMLTNHQIIHQITHNVGFQIGNCRWPLNLLQRFVWACMGLFPLCQIRLIIGFFTPNFTLIINKFRFAKNVADPALAELDWTHPQRGQEQFQSFIEGMGNERESTVYKPIKRNKVALFKHGQAASSSKEKVLKDNCQLFSWQFISCQTRQCELQEFFNHENQPTSVSLSDSGKLDTCQKSQLTEILQAQVILPDKGATGGWDDAISIDGSDYINAIPPQSSKTFDDYAREDILPKVIMNANGAKYMHVNSIRHLQVIHPEVWSQREKGIRYQ